MTADKVNPATRFLLRAFAPGCPTMLRHWTARRAGRGERVTLTYDLVDGKARLRALELAKSAPSLVQVAVGKLVIRDLAVTVEDQTLTVEALLVSAGRFTFRRFRVAGELR